MAGSGGGGVKTGAQTNAIETSKWKRRKMAKKRRSEEKEWASKCGPVTVYFREPDERSSP